MTAWMTLNGQNALLRQKSSYEDENNLNEDRPISTECRPMILVTRSIRLVRIFAGFPGQGVQTDSGVIENGHFDLSFEISHSKVHIIIRYAGPRRLFGDPKMCDLEWPLSVIQGISCRNLAPDASKSTKLLCLAYTNVPLFWLIAKFDTYNKFAAASRGSPAIARLCCQIVYTGLSGKCY